ncbi:MAG: arginine-tRNA-protein transferase [Benjaminiella poitrasii]|nr:MAG: arginine-tRNA-protein transferase [Benjaminiella poitrasii]
MSKDDNSTKDHEESMSEEENEFDIGYSIISVSGPSKHNCGYCKGEDTSISFGIWAHALTCNDYQDLIDRGWRRSGKYLYKPDLEKSCCPQYTIRLDTTKFAPSKSQKKIIHKFNRYIIGSWDPHSTEKTTKTNSKESKKEKRPDNYVQIQSLQDMVNESEITSDNKYEFKSELEPSSFTKEKFKLYAKYQASVHHDEEEDISEAGFKRFLVDSPMKIESSNNDQVRFGSFHQKYTLNGKLFALAVIDILPKCVSSVYFIYDPDYSFLGLGKYSVFKEISLVQKYNESISTLRYYYMGFYIHTCPKMNYKGQYQPSDLLDPLDYSWHPIEEFKEKMDREEKNFVSFSNSSNKKRDYPAGWIDPTSITKDDLEHIFIFIDQGRIAPLKYIVQFESSSKFRRTMLDYICSVGLELARKMFIT